jgi:hypothetical protein
VFLNPDAPSGMQADSDRGASTCASEIERPSEARLNDLKALLRLKRANPAPTMKSREAARPSSHGQSTSLPLSSLLQTISRVASSTKLREIPGLKS